MSYDRSLTFKGLGYTKYDIFIATRDHSIVDEGDILVLRRDDRSSCPYYTIVFKKSDDYKVRIERRVCFAISWTKKINKD